MPILETKNITFSYEEKPTRHVIHNMSFGIEKGTMTVLLGLSGCGKSTLCQILSGIIPECIKGNIQGQIFFDSEDVTSWRLSQRACKIGYVMQDPDRQMIATTVEDELAFGLENLCVPAEEIWQRVDAMMKLLNIEHLRLRNPQKLSGGEKQVVAIAAILVVNPEIIMLDEPLSHLDEKGRAMVCDVLQVLKDGGRTLLIVEQDYEMLDFADKWIVINKGEILQEGIPGDLNSQEILF